MRSLRIRPARLFAAGLLAICCIVRSGRAGSDVERVLSGLSLEQKLGQLLMVRFDGPSYGDDADAMLRGYGVGAVVLYAKGGNIVDESQLGTLTAAMQEHSALPLLVAVDQEGGRVDRLVSVRGPRPSAATIAARGDPALATEEGANDARDLARYGIQLNLAPVVDVTRVFNGQLDQRTFGDRPEVVIRLAGAYLQALQRDGRVAGVLKHFPGLGSVGEDPHAVVPHVAIDRAELDAVDWAPYRALIARGDVAAVMVTHVMLAAVDPVRPSSLSGPVVTGILREHLGFSGAVIADALTMKGVGATGLGDAALEALQAGVDGLMGPASAADVAAVLAVLKGAVAAGTLSEARVDASVRRMLALKERVGLLPAGRR